jgi:predicted dehydrogenase
VTAQLDLDLVQEPLLPREPHTIGIVGGGWIVRECHLPAYLKAGLNVEGIASRTRANAEEVAQRFGIPKVYGDWRELAADAPIDVLDIAFPPDQQLAVVEHAVRHNQTLRAILAQKPLAPDASTAAEIVRLCREADIVLGVNQNMRYDRSIRALHTLLKRGYLGTPLSAQITMHARVHWMPYASTYERLALLIMSVHHLDTFRYLFGEPDRVIASVRRDHELDRPHIDGMAVYVLEYADEFRAIAIDNCLTTTDQGIEWRVEGTRGIARGTIGWPDYPSGSPSTIDFTTDLQPGYWFRPRWEERWFPDAFIGTMGELIRALEDGVPPPISGEDNLKTIALVDGAYASARTRSAVEVANSDELEEVEA